MGLMRPFSGNGEKIQCDCFRPFLTFFWLERADVVSVYRAYRIGFVRSARKHLSRQRHAGNRTSIQLAAKQTEILQRGQQGFERGKPANAEKAIHVELTERGEAGQWGTGRR